jgi:hypothetical protein
MGPRAPPRGASNSRISSDLRRVVVARTGDYRAMALSPSSATPSEIAKRVFSLRGQRVEVANCDFKLGRAAKAADRLHGARRHHGRHRTE